VRESEKGQKALSLLRDRFLAKADTKAQQALANVEQDPDDEDYQKKLLKETARLASADSTFAQDLKVVAEHVALAQSGSVTIENTASNYSGRSPDVERNGKTEERLNSKIPSIFDHIVQTSSTIESYYHLEMQVISTCCCFLARYHRCYSNDVSAKDEFYPQEGRFALLLC